MIALQSSLEYWSTCGGGWGKVPGDYFYADPGFKYLDKVLVGAD